MGDFLIGGDQNIETRRFGRIQKSAIFQASKLCECCRLTIVIPEGMAQTLIKALVGK